MILKAFTKSRLLFSLHYKDGDTHILFADEHLLPACERWIKYGLNEWIEDGGGTSPRQTLSTSPEFLPRIKSYLKRQSFNFRFELTYRDALDQEVKLVS